MADITYTVTEISPEEISGFEQYSEEDKDLLNSFEINNLFDPSKNHIELGIFDFSNNLLEYDSNYKNYYQLGNAQSAGRSGASTLTIDPVKDTQAYGYELGGVILLYHLLNDLYTVNNSSTEFFIESISEDRTELRLLAVSLTDNEIVNLTAQIKSNLERESYYSDFRLNFKNNDLFIGINIDTVDINQGKAVVVKLYEPLPDDYSEKSKLSIVDIVSDSVSYNIDYRVIETPPIQPTLRSPNFNLEISDENTVPTGYLDYNDLFSYPVENANSEIYSLFNEKGIDVSIDFTDYSDFIHFSSAEERLNNLKYKIDLISDYSASLSSIQTGALGSRTYFENLITGIISNFDHYERFVYYESGSSSWPKSNSTRPYENIPSVDPITYVPNAVVSAWYSTQLTQAIAFDRINGNSLVNAVPSYLKDDNDNVNYLTFIYMIGQHFDNLWTYARAVTDKYDGDNRMNHGISKDLVGEALKNFGVKLYTSNKSIEDLFGSLIGQSYQSGSEYITDYIVAIPTGSNIPIEPAGLDNYQKEIQKRIYHNLPLLLKSKGTERGLRALINCFGIPSDILQIKYFGGRNTTERPFFGDYSYYTSSLDKVRLDNTGSIIPKNTLSGNTSNIKRDSKYTDDLHNIEVGFAPSDNVDRYIISHSAATFNIDDYIGDPRSLTSPSYTGLYQIAEGILGNLERYDLRDYVRLIKFFDNVIFKMVKDFIPARVVADTGIIIKPNLLNRSKIKSVSLEVARPEQSGSVDTAFIESRDGGVYYSGSTETITAYLREVKTPIGTSWKRDHYHEEARYDGELYNSGITITDGELEKNNPYLTPIYPTSIYNVGVYNIPPAGFCLINPNGLTQNIQINSLVNLCTFFISANANTQFSVGSSLSSLIPLPSQTFSFGAIAGEYYYIRATDPLSTLPCNRDTVVITDQCTVFQNTALETLVSQGEVITLAEYFNNPTSIALDFYINGILYTETTYTVPSNAIATNNLQFTLTAKSYGNTCSSTRTFNISTIAVTLSLFQKYVTTLDARILITLLAGNTFIIEKGIVWSPTNTNPTVGGIGCDKLPTTLPHTAEIPIYPSPLIPNTQYYLRAYVTTAFGTLYSNRIETTTMGLGSITISNYASSAGFIAFEANAVNDPILSIKEETVSVLVDGPNDTVVAMLQSRQGIYFEYSSPDPAYVNSPPSSKYEIEIGLLGPGQYDAIHNFTIEHLQSNTLFNFIAKIRYTQGNSPHILEVVSTPIQYLSPALTIGQSFQGGLIFNVIQNVRTLAPNPEFFTNGTPVRRVLIVYPNDIPAASNPAVYPTPSQTLASNRATGIGGNIGWKLPTQEQQIILHNSFASIPNNQINPFHWYWNNNASTSSIVNGQSQYVALKFTDTITPLTSDGRLAPYQSSYGAMYIRPVNLIITNHLGNF